MQAALHSPDGLVESDVEDDTYVATDDVGEEIDVDEMSFDIVFVVFDWVVDVSWMEDINITV